MHENGFRGTPSGHCNAGATSSGTLWNFSADTGGIRNVGYERDEGKGIVENASRRLIMHLTEFPSYHDYSGSSITTPERVK